MKRVEIILAIAFVALLAVSAAGLNVVQAGYAKQPMAIYPTAKNAGFNTLTAAIEAAGLETVLTEEGPFTVFAPTDEAFAKLPEGTVESLLADKEALTQVLLYHVVSGSVMSSDVVELTSAEMLNGQKVRIDAKDGVHVNDARVIKTDIKAKNGVIHVIDTVLIPSSAGK
jgi:uncharacterized surface protein with fasciclin (FAS1) repeats